MNGKHEKELGTALTLICFITLATCASGGAAQNYNRDLVMSILWQQNSGEYAALCHQAFNMGKIYIKTLPDEKGRAVVLDIDETILDNSPYAAWMAKTGNPWANETWEAWCNEAVAGAVPGSLDFTLFLQKNNIEIFYISNRPASTKSNTVLNMKNIGFPFSDDEHTALMETTSDKTPRIENIKKQGRKIILYAGDNLDDFDSSIRRLNNEERVKWTDGQIENFGAYWIVLPNAVYGTFESAIKQNYYGLPQPDKASARLQALNVWNHWEQ
jgi:5'-nucleotidase (lipoprotein e(P4) family)